MLFYGRRHGEKSWVKKYEAETSQSAAEICAEAIHKGDSIADLDVDLDIEVRPVDGQESDAKVFSVATKVSVEYIARTLHSDPSSVEPRSKGGKTKSAVIDGTPAVFTEDDRQESLSGGMIGSDVPKATDISEETTEEVKDKSGKDKSARKAERSKQSAKDFSGDD